MKKIIRISLKSLWCKYNILFLMVIVIATAMPSMLFNVSDGILNSIEYTKKINFGYFTDLLVVDNNTIINNVIKLAGGFKSNAYKNNINLSKKVSSEMVVYVYTKTEYAKSKDTNISSEEVICKTPDYNIDNCVDNKTSIIENGENKDLDNSKNDDKQSNSDNINNKTVVNINTADVKMLTSLSGIGESKAETIVDYRNKNGNFKSIDDIMNVSGIGEALFEKIKDYITV